MGLIGNIKQPAAPVEGYVQPHTMMFPLRIIMVWGY